MAIVVGANDVTNPAARTKPDSPLYGMPILDVEKARTVGSIKRSTGPGSLRATTSRFTCRKR